jgi:hypothetical protein
MKGMSRMRSTALGLGLAGLLGGCTSLQNQNGLEAFKAAEKSTSPIVEAFFEYGGPDSRWAGPSALIVRVDARERGMAKVTSQPQVRLRHLPADGTTAGRGLASVSSVTSDEARTQLAEIATQMQADAQTFSGCLYPLRVRLVRQDGGVLEKHGCRSTQGWPSAVSKAVSFYLTK